MPCAESHGITDAFPVRRRAYGGASLQRLKSSRLHFLKVGSRMEPSIGTLFRVSKITYRKIRVPFVLRRWVPMRIEVKSSFRDFTSGTQHTP